MTDFRGRIIEASEEAAALLSTESGVLVGTSLASFVADERRREFGNLLRDLAHGGAPIGGSFRLGGRGGAAHTVDVDAVAETTGERLEWLIAATGEHGGDGVDPASALGAPQLGRLLSRLPVGVVSVDRALTVEYANPTARVFLGGVEAGEALRNPWLDLPLREFALDLFAGVEPVRRIIESEAGRIFELDGIPPEQAGSAIILLQDVTFRERHRRAEREFVANASHELRTPIAAITSSIEALQAGAKDDPVERELFLAHVARESERLSRLVAALLLLARIQVGQQVPSLSVVPIEPLLDEVVAELRPAEGVAVRAGGARGVNVLADEDLLRQAISNLAANAAKHTMSGEIAFVCRDLGHIAEIEVRDTGSGILAEDVDHVFDRFFRSDRTGSGYGLGLPLTQEIVRALGGVVTLESELGVGTRVCVYIPSARPVAP